MSSAAAPFVVGIDGGGSKTLLAVADREGAVLALQRDAGSNPFDARDWQDVLRRLAVGAAEFAPRVAHAAFALPGYGEVEAISAAQTTAASACGFAACSVLNDVEAAFEAAFAGRPGVLLLAGTGSMVWARTREGKDVRVGGWGEAFGDEGSAFWIGRDLVARVSRALDDRLAAPRLAAALFDHLGLDPAQPQGALTSWYLSHTHRRSAIAALAPFVDRQAAAEDRTALAILDEAAAHLALHVEAAWRSMAEGERAPWSYAGGAFRSAILLGRVTERLGVEPRDPVLPPIGGALLRAAVQAGWAPGPAWLEHLRTALAARNVSGKNDETGE